MKNAETVALNMTKEGARPTTKSVLNAHNCIILQAYAVKRDGIQEVGEDSRTEDPDEGDPEDLTRTEVVETTTEATIQGIITTEGTPTTTIEETPKTTIEETTVTTIEVVIQEAETMDSKETLVVATRVSKAQSELSMKEGMKMASTMGYKTNKITHQTHLKRV